MLTWRMTSAVLSIVVMLTNTCRTPWVAAVAAAGLELEDLLGSKVIVRRASDDVGLHPFEENNQNSPSVARFIDRNRSFLRELFDSDRSESHLQPFAQHVTVDHGNLFRGTGGTGRGGSEDEGLGRGTVGIRRSKRPRWQGFCFAKTRSGRYLPYICWKGDVKRPSTNRNQRFGRR